LRKGGFSESRSKPKEAAIQLVESIVPEAEELARESLRKVFQLRLEILFSNGNRVDEVF
jgi:hypothetical protein